MDIQKEREAFEQSNNVNPDWSFKFDEELQQYIALDSEMELQVDEFNELWDAFRAGWQAAKAQAVPEWISVEDGLPSDGQNIIAFDAIKHCVFKDGEFLQGYFEPDTGHEYTEPVDVTHWIAIEVQEQSHV